MSDQPRDRLGRPLRGSAGQAFPGVPEREQVSSELAWHEALAYLADDLPFHAHEVFEQRWRCCPEEERTAWRAAAQWAAALTQQARGNDKGAALNAAKAVATLDRAGLIPSPLDESAIRASLTRLLR